MAGTASSAHVVQESHSQQFYLCDGHTFASMLLVHNHQLNGGLQVTVFEEAPH